MNDLNQIFQKLPTKKLPAFSTLIHTKSSASRALKIYIMWRKWPKPLVLGSRPLSAALIIVAGTRGSLSLAAGPQHAVESEKAVIWP